MGDSDCEEKRASAVSVECVSGELDPSNCLKAGSLGVNLVPGDGGVVGIGPVANRSAVPVRRPYTWSDIMFLVKGPSVSDAAIVALSNGAGASGGCTVDVAENDDGGPDTLLVSPLPVLRRDPAKPVIFAIVLAFKL